MLHFTLDHDGCLHGRLLDAAVGRSGTAYQRWLNNQPEWFSDSDLDRTLRTLCGLSRDAIAVLDAFQVVRLGITETPAGLP